MATAAESTFYAAIVKAEGIRQAAKAAAFATYAFSPAGFATYVAALATADDTYFTSVNAANSGPFGYTTPNTGTTGPNIEAGVIGFEFPSALNDIGGAYGTAGMGGIA